MTIGAHTQPAQKRKRELRPLKGPGAVRGRGDGASRIDYTAEALADFQRYAAAADLAPDLRGFAAETLHLIRRSARAHGNGTGEKS